MELNAYFKSLVDQDRAAVVICDLEHTIIYMNPAAIASYAKHGGAALLDVYMVALRDADGTLIGYYERHEYRNPETMKLYDME